MDNLVLKKIGHNRSGKNWSMPSHSHSHTEIVVINHGAENVKLNRGRAELHSAGRVLIFRPGVFHAEEAVPDYGYIDSWFIAINTVLPDEIPSFLDDDQGRVRALCSWLESQREASDSLTLEQNELFLRAIVTELKRLVSSHSGSLVSNARNLVRSNLNHVWDLESLAEMAGLSKYHFLRRYKQESGSTPVADIRLIRVNAARDLLLTTRLPLKAIAAQCGFYNEVALSRIFKQVFGCTPGSLRK